MRLKVKNAVEIDGWYIDIVDELRLRREYEARKAKERAKRKYRPFCKGLKVRYGGFKLTNDAIKSQGTRVRECRASGAGDAIDRFAPPKRCYRAPFVPTENAPVRGRNGAYKGPPRYDAPTHAYRGERPEFHDQSRDLHFALARAKRARKFY